MYAKIAVDYTEATIASWEPNTVCVIRDNMTHLMRKTITAIVLGQENSVHSNVLEEVMTAAVTEYDRRNQNWLLALMPETIPTPGNLRYQRAVQQLNQLLYPLIKDRRNSNDDHGDMLSILLQVRDEDGVGMNDVELRDELVGLLLAHDSVADVLNWGWWLLAQNPEAEEKLLAEWQSVLGGRSPTFEDIPKLRYTECVVMEILRLYPLAWSTGRVVTQDCCLGGYPIHAGENVVMCQWVTHRDRRFFADPDTFNPDRWLDEVFRRKSAHTYFPFGGGPRSCIGRGLTMMESVLVFPTIGQRFQVQPIPGQQAIPYPNPSFSLRPKVGLKMQLLPR
jgi:cytochrome P450